MSIRKKTSTIFTIPILGYLLRTVYTVVRLPKVYDSLVDSDGQLHNDLAAAKAEVEKLRQKNSDLANRLGSLQNVQDNVQQHISTLERNQGSVTTKKGATTKSSDEALFADDHFLDKFYTAFEDKFRGSEKMIVNRQKYYLPRFKKSTVDFGKTPVLDIGSGRGEFIQLLESNAIDSVGLDINHDMVARSKGKGLIAVQGDALSHLRQAKSRQYGAITGFHIVEHIPFNVLLRIFVEAHRALAQDGFVLFETPNPESLIVGSTTFYMDPSHLHPVPPALLAFTLEFCGFRNVEILRLHPDERLKKPGLTKDARELLYGPRDYAVIGYK